MNTQNTAENAGKKAANIERRARLQIKEKWGDGVGRGGNTGFVALPEALVRGQKRLGLTSTEMMVLINAIMHWWYHDEPPFPGNRSIARRMGVSPRTVQRAFESLEKKGLVSREIRKFTEDDRETDSKTPYDSRRYLHLGGLVQRVEEISDDLREYNENTTKSDIKSK